MILHDVYSLFKPAIPLRIRLSARRLIARRLRRKCSHVWPINEAAGRVPDGWPGWPEGKQFAFALTHDVEAMKGLERTRLLAELEIEMGFRSSFNFVPEGDYRVSDGLRKFLTKNRFEVGVHDLHHDGALYRSWDTFKESASQINHYIREWEAVGFRSGFMRHDLEWLGELDVLYDSSTFDTDPFEPQPDGVDTVFPFWVSHDQRCGYVELPYTLAQDSTLFLVLREQSIRIWKEKLDWVASKGGLALVNVHPDYISFNGTIGEGEYGQQLYRELLHYVRDRYSDQCWFALPKEVATYYRHNVVTSSALNKCMASQENKPSLVEVKEVAAQAPLQLKVGNGAEAQTIVARPFEGKRMAVVSFSPFPGDPRPRRAAETFSQAGMSVDIVCRKDEGECGRDVFKGMKVDRVAIKHERGSKLGYLLRYILFIGIAFAKLAGRSCVRRYDVIHIHNMPDVLVLAALVPKLLGAKVILDLHDPMPELMMTIFGFRKDSRAVTFMALLEKWSIAMADTVITVNRACEKIFSARSCPASKVVVIMNSPDESIFRLTPVERKEQSASNASGPFVMMYHGTLVERNGVDLAVEALARTRSVVPKAELHIYGPRTPFLDRVFQAVSERGLQDAVRYLGPRRLEELPDAIATCDVGVIPNKRSIFTELNTPTRIFEYLASGKPVIAPRAPGIQDYFGEGDLLYFELGNPDDLASRLIWAATHSQETFEIARRGQAIYMQHNWSKQREQLLQLGARLVADGGDAR